MSYVTSSTIGNRTIPGASQIALLEDNLVDKGSGALYDEGTFFPMSMYQEYRTFVSHYQAYKDKIYNYFYYRTAHDVAVAEDLTSEVFLKAYERFDSYNAEYEFSTWIYRIARNTLVDHLRRSSVRKTEELLDAAVDEDSERFLDTIDESIDMERVRKVLATLPKTQRRYVEERYFEYKEVLEIAEAHETNEVAVRKNISRGIQKLRELLLILVIMIVGI